MRIIRPISVTPANGVLTASNITENDATEWDDSTNFDKGDTVMVTTTANGASAATHLVYESQIDTNNNNDPTVTTTLAGTTTRTHADKWLIVGYTDKYKAFDQRVGDQATNASSITYELTLTDLFSAVALFNLDAAHLDIKMVVDEPARNLLAYTEQLDNAAWTKTNATITANAAVAPDGSETADQVDIDTTAGEVYQADTVTAGTEYTASWYAWWTAEETGLSYGIYDVTNSAWIDKATYTIGDDVSDARKSVTFTTPAGCTSVEIYPLMGDGAATGSAYIWGAHLESGTLTDYQGVEGADEVIVRQTGVDLFDNSTVIDFYTWFFEPITRISEYVSFDWPPYTSSVVTVNLSVSSGDAAVGEVVVGAQKDMGWTVLGTSINIVDFSTVEADTFGVYEFVKRPFSDRVEFDLRFRNNDVAGVKRILSSFRATPIVWSGTAEGDTYGTLVYGAYRDFDITLSTSVISDCTLEVWGLT